MTQRKYEQYHLLELEPLIAIIKHLYWKRKCNILVERRDEVLGQVKFFMENIQIYSSICLLLCSGSIRRQMSKGLLLDIQGNDRVSFLTSKQERVLNKKKHFSAQQAQKFLFSSHLSLSPKDFFYECFVRRIILLSYFVSNNINC